MNAGAESQMTAGFLSVDLERHGIVDEFVVPIAGDVPHHHPVAFLDRFSLEFSISQSRAAHVNDG